MEKYLKRKKIFLNKGEQQPDSVTSEDGEPLAPSPPLPTLVSTGTPKTAKKPKTDGKYAQPIDNFIPVIARIRNLYIQKHLFSAAKKKPAQVRKSSRRSRSSMDVAGDDDLLSKRLRRIIWSRNIKSISLVDAPDVGLAEELISDIPDNLPDMQLEGNVIEEKFEDIHDGKFI